MRERFPAGEVSRDRRDVDFAWRPIAVVSAEEADVPHAGGLGLVQDSGDLTGVPHAQGRAGGGRPLGLLPRGQWLATVSVKVTVPKSGLLAVTVTGPEAGEPDRSRGRKTRGRPGR